EQGGDGHAAAAVEHGGQRPAGHHAGLGVADQLFAPVEPHGGQPARHRHDLQPEGLVVGDGVGKKLLEQRDTLFPRGEGFGHSVIVHSSGTALTGLNSRSYLHARGGDRPSGAGVGNWLFFFSSPSTGWRSAAFTAWSRSASCSFTRRRSW